MAWEQFWNHVVEKQYNLAKADLIDYDRVFNAQPTMEQLPTSDLLDILESQQYSSEYIKQLRLEITRRCIDPPHFVPKMPRDEYTLNRKNMIQALLKMQK